MFLTYDHVTFMKLVHLYQGLLLKYGFIIRQVQPYEWSKTKMNLQQASRGGQNFQECMVKLQDQTNQEFKTHAEIWQL